MPIDKEKLGFLGSQKTTYEEWRDQHGIPVVTGFYIEDLKTVELAPWAWKGGQGAFLNLEGIEEINDSYLCEIPAGGKLEPMRHMYDETVHILTGRGATKIWQDGQEPITFEWQSGSIFSIPLNANYQHFNGSGNETARYLGVTFAPMVLNLFHNLDFVFNNSFTFLDRFDGEENFFKGEGRELTTRVWDSNFIADVNKLELKTWNERGKGSTNRVIEMANSSLGSHVSQIEVGKYKKAHRHGPGAHVIIIAGEGYSLMWPEGSEIQRYDWKPGCLIVPPDRWFHQHFNVGATPAKYLAMRGNSVKYKVLKQYEGIDKDVRSGGLQIEHQNEDPQVRKMFEAELAKRGVKSKMDEVFNSLN